MVKSVAANGGDGKNEAGDDLNECRLDDSPCANSAYSIARLVLEANERTRGDWLASLATNLLERIEETLRNGGFVDGAHGDAAAKLSAALDVFANVPTFAARARNDAGASVTWAMVWVRAVEQADRDVWERDGIRPPDCVARIAAEEIARGSRLLGPQESPLEITDTQRFGVAMRAAAIEYRERASSKREAVAAALAAPGCAAPQWPKANSFLKELGRSDADANKLDVKRVADHLTRAALPGRFVWLLQCRPREGA